MGLRLLISCLPGGARPFAQFGLVGVSALLLNSLLLAVATEVAGIYYLVSAALAVQGATLWRFALMGQWVFAGRRRTRGRAKRLTMFLLANNAALLVRGPAIYLLTSILGVHYLVSNLVSLAGLLLLRYALADGWIWGER